MTIFLELRGWVPGAERPGPAVLLLLVLRAR